MHRMERLHQPLNIPAGVEALDRQRRIELPDLRLVARFDEELLLHLCARRALQGLAELIEFGVDLRKRLVHAVLVEAAGNRDAAARLLENDVGELHSAGGHRGGGLGQDRRLASQLARDRHDIEPCRSATGDEHALARIEPLAHRDLVNRLDHQLVRDRDDRERGILYPASQLAGELRNDALRGRAIERHPPAVEIGRIDVPEHDAGVGDRRLIAAPSIARGPGHGARTLRSDAKQAARINPCDRASTGADASHIHGGHRHHVADPAASEPAVSRVDQIAVAHQAHVKRRPAGIADDGIAAKRLDGRVGLTGYRRHRGTGFQHLHRPGGDFGDVLAPAGGGSDQEFSLETRGAQVVLHFAQVLLHERLERRVDGGR